MSSVYPAPTYGGQQPPPGAGYYASAPPGTVQPPQGYPPQGYPPQAYYAPPGSAPPPGYAAPQQYAASPGYTTPQQYAAPPGYAPPAGYAPPPGYAQPPGYPPSETYAGTPTGPYAIPVAGAYPSPQYGNATPVAGGYPPPQYGNATAVAYQGYAPPTDKQAPPQDPANRIDNGRWAAGLCDCCNDCVPNLCMSWCCPCVSLAQIYARLGLGRYWVVLTRLLVLVVAGIILQMITPGDNSEPTWDETNGDYTTPAPPSPVSTAGSIGYLVIELALMFHVLHARQRVRQRFQIPGNSCCDCLVSCCCSCCAIAQMATHVKSYTPGSCGFGAPDVLPAFNYPKPRIIASGTF